MERCRPLIAQALVNITYRARLQEQVAVKTEALQASERRFRSFAAMASDWFWETDAEHRLSYASEPGYLDELTRRQSDRPSMTMSATSRAARRSNTCGCWNSASRCEGCGCRWRCLMAPAGWR